MHPEIRQSGWMLQAQASGLTNRRIVLVHWWPHLRAIVMAQFTCSGTRLYCFRSQPGPAWIRRRGSTAFLGNLLQDLQHSDVVRANPLGARAFGFACSGRGLYGQAARPPGTGLMTASGMNRKRVLPVLAVGAFVAFGASSSKELRFAIAGDPRSFDPLHIEDSNTEMVKYLTAGVLVRVNRATDQVQPELAETWALSEGGRALTFHLRAGLKFSDGSPFTSADVARTLTRALDPKEASPAGDSIRDAEGNPQIRVTSPRDITIRYKTPKPGLDRLFDGIGIGPAEPGKPVSERKGLPASAGPFFISEYRRGEYARLLRNPNYWKRDSSGRPLPYLDSIRLDIQQNHDIELTRFLRGEFQAINRLEPDSFVRLRKERPAAARNLGASLDSEFIWFNQAPSRTVPDWKRKWFTSTAFRHAISLSIHRDDIVRIVFGGNAHVAAGPVSTANRFWFNASLKPLSTDTGKALKLLSAEGFVFNSGVLRDRAGHPVEFSLITNSGNRPRERLGQLVQSDLAKIGIRINFVPWSSVR